MLPRIRCSRLLLLAAAITASALSWACQDEPTAPSINARAGGGSGGGGPKVSSVDPDSATQDTTLDVAVFGSGFDRGSKVEFALDGVVGPNIRTNSTRFVNKTKLIANITIAADAATDVYDVIVTTSQGKPGMGTEMFTVTLKVEDLGTLGGPYGSDAHRINNLGHVVGVSSTPEGEYRGFFWSDSDSMMNLGTLPGYNMSDAHGINDLDQVVGDAVCGTYANGSGCTGLPRRAALWERLGGGWAARELPVDSGYATAEDVNNRGMIIGHTSPQTICVAAPIRIVAWVVQGSSVTRQELPVLPAAIASGAYAINDSGQAVGSSGSCSSWEATLWAVDAGGAWSIMRLGQLPGGSNSRAYDIGEMDAAGRVYVVGIGRNAAGNMRAIRWTVRRDAGGQWQVAMLEDLGEHAVDSNARGVGSNGTVVGSISLAHQQAARWPLGGSVEFLPSLANGNGGSGEYASDINDGGWIVGGSQGRAVLWRVR